jgi:hypothetical protein
VAAGCADRFSLALQQVPYNASADVITPVLQMKPSR